MVVGGANNNNSNSGQPKLDETEQVLQQILSAYATDQDVSSAKTLAQLRREITDVFETKQRTCNATIKGLKKKHFISLFYCVIFLFV